MKRLIVNLCLATFALGAPQGSQTPVQSAESVIRTADQAWANAVASRSIEETVSFYDPEALTAGSIMPPARGLAAVRAMWTEIFSQPGFSLTWKVDKVVVVPSGSIAYSTGTWRMGANASGPYFAVWRKQPDGKWKVLMDAAWDLQKRE